MFGYSVKSDTKVVLRSGGEHGVATFDGRLSILYIAAYLIPGSCFCFKASHSFVVGWYNLKQHFGLAQHVCEPSFGGGLCSRIPRNGSIYLPRECKQNRTRPRKSKLAKMLQERRKGKVPCQGGLQIWQKKRWILAQSLIAR